MASDDKYVTLTEENFKGEVLEASQPVLVDFWADWCGPCRIIAPMIGELAADFEGKAVVGKVNIDEQPSLATQFGIHSIPTLLIFQDGKVVDRVVGVVPKGALGSKLNALLPAA